ncbi:MAG: 5'-methylthioadenosine/S-adenosylhomocysteine nucleosidase [Clostridia bacterium]|nr:5'-methylthioadenosine/S-adenosylhomocysteine nucleosidase [Clostridia bacterium]
MKRIGMLVAVEIDSVLCRYGTPGETKEYPGYTILTYHNDGYTLYVLNSGAGQIAAAAGVQFLISELQVEMIVNFGVVGGLTPDMAQTRTCLVDRVVHYEFDTSPIDNCEVGRHLEYPDIYLPATPELVKRALEIEPSLKAVTCASGDKFVDTAERKAELHKTFGADICEMEAAAIVLTCNRNGIPCLMIKTVSDSLTGGAEEFLTGLERTSEVCLEVADRIIKEL